MLEDSELLEVPVRIYPVGPQRLAQEYWLEMCAKWKWGRTGERMAVTRTCLCELSHLTERVIGEKRQGV